MQFRISLVVTFSLLLSLLSAQSFSTIEVTIPTSDPAVTLAGSLTIPGQSGKHPAVLLIWGDGPHTRDVEISGSPIFKQIAEFLAARGMLVLRVDKRGFGASTGPKTESEGNYTTYDLVTDLKAAYHFLNQHPAVDTSRVGLIGHSEGAIIAPILAAEEKSVDWLMVFGPPAVPGDSIVATQTRLNRKQLGMLEETSRAVERVWQRYMQFIEEGNTNDSVYYAIGRDFLLAHGMEKDDERITHEFIDQLLDGYKTPWYQYFFNTNPADYIRKIQVPVLAVFGGEDQQVTVKQNLLPMYEAYKQGGYQQYQIVVLPDEDHFFVRYKDQRLTKHKFGEMQISGRLMATLEDWLEEEGILRP